MLTVRSEVLFDATNRKHRKAYDQYLRNNRSWHGCEYRFRAPHYGIVVGYIERRLLEYYTNKEFGKKQVSEEML
jgi:hypothetical protein